MLRGTYSQGGLNGTESLTPFATGGARPEGGPTRRRDRREGHPPTNIVPGCETAAAKARGVPVKRTAMGRAHATRLVAKLRALGDDRAATEAEKALARAKADELSARFRLGVAEEARPRPQASRPYRFRRTWVVSPDSDWLFNAKVEHHWGDWRINVEVGWRIEPNRAHRATRSRRAV